MERASRAVLGAFALFLLTLGAAGCSLHQSVAADQRDALKGIRRIAVMPVRSGTAEQRLLRLMRERVLEALYFKGYPKIPLEVVDERLAGVCQEAAAGRADLCPRDVVGRLGVDAALHVDLKEFRTSTAMVYSSTSVSATFELLSAGNGEALWRNRYEEVIRHFGLTRADLIVTVNQVIEPAMREMVDKVLQTLPDGFGGVAETDRT